MEIHPAYQPRRKKPFVARWSENGRQRNRFFSTAEARDSFIRGGLLNTSRKDPTLPEIPLHRLIRWQQAARLDPLADPVEVFQFWVKAQRTQPALTHRTLSEAAAAYLLSMQRLGRDDGYIRHVQRTLAHLQTALGDRPLREISTAMLVSYLFKLPFEALTIRNRRTYLLVAFGWWLKQGWLETNPMKQVDVPNVVDKEPGILTVPETLQLFRANEKIDPDICGLLALGAFAGMRSSAIARLEYSELDFAQRGILTPAEKTKKKRRQWIEDLPDNLWAWLKRTPASAFRMEPRHLLHRRCQAFKRADLLIESEDLARENARRQRHGESHLRARPKCPPKNCLRHSFVTYHVALHRNPGKTALIISHRDQDCLYRHYLGIANQKDAEQYFAIRPNGM